MTDFQALCLCLLGIVTLYVLSGLVRTWGVVRTADALKQSVAAVTDRRKAIEEAAAYAEFYANERMMMTRDGMEASRTATDSTQALQFHLERSINHAACLAAKDIAEHLRGLAAKEAR